MRLAAFTLATLFATASATFNCHPGTSGDGRYCCIKNHSVCQKQRGGGVGTCYSSATVYCGNCGADCCTYDPNAPLYTDNSGSGSRWTSSANVYGTHCKS